MQLEPAVADLTVVVSLPGTPGAPDGIRMIRLTIRASGTGCPSGPMTWPFTVIPRRSTTGTSRGVSAGFPVEGDEGVRVHATAAGLTLQDHPLAGLLKDVVLARAPHDQVVGLRRDRELE